MEYRNLGRTDIKVSLICLGTMTFGEQNTQDEAFAQMDYAVEQGVNFFDTAELYAVPPKPDTYGRTEEIVGNWLKQSGKRRDIVVATKVVGPAGAMPWIRDGQTRLDRANIMAAVDASLKRLQTDYIDLYQTHWPKRPVNSFGKLGFDQNAVTGREIDVIGETLAAMDELVKSGRVRHVGLSNETPWGVMAHLKVSDAKNLPRVVSIQNPYSLLNRTFDVGLAEIAMQEKVGLLAYAPLAAGALTGKYLNGQVPKGSRWDVDPRPSRYKKAKSEEAITAYVGIAKKYGMDPSTLANAFVNMRPFLTSNIVGATKVDHLKISIASASVKLSPEILADIEQAHVMTPNPCP
jgi:aryl-alcohol dehydrogenase-like predicted oxidoreductase